MKVHNSSTHLVKGCNLYCSRWLTHSISPKWFHTAIFFLNYCLVLGNAVSDWWADSFSLALWRPQNSQTPPSFPRLSSFMALKGVSHFAKLSKTSKDRFKRVLLQQVSLTLQWVKHTSQFTVCWHLSSPSSSLSVEQEYQYGAFIQKQPSIITIYIMLTHSFIFASVKKYIKQKQTVHLLSCTMCVCVRARVHISFITFKHNRAWADFQISRIMEGRS